MNAYYKTEIVEVKLQMWHRASSSWANFADDQFGNFFIVTSFQ